MSTSIPFRDDLAFRIRLFAVLLGLLVLLAFSIALLAYGPSTLVSFGFITILLLMLVDTIILYLLANSPYARINLYITLCLIVILLGFVDFVTGTLSGGMWVLFQLTPPIAVLVLREARAILIMIAVSLPVMLIVGSLEIIGVIPVTLLATPQALMFNLSMQVLIMVVLGFIMHSIAKREMTIFRELFAARQDADQQLQRVNQLLAHQQDLNTELAESMRLMRESQAQLAYEQEQQSDLRRTISLLAAPIVPVLPGLVVIPLVGFFDQKRLEALVETILAGVKDHQVHTVVLDLTGMQSMDDALTRTLLSLIAMMRLLGCKTVVVGISPEGAESLVSLGVNVDDIETLSTLQEAIGQIVKQTHTSAIGLGTQILK
jgi:rsbT co-antagonist protein RsbR